MNNLNEPPVLNIIPDQRDDGDGNKCYYALLVPMLGLAAYRWIWECNTQKQIQEITCRYENELMVTFKQLEKVEREKEQVKAKDFLNELEKGLVERQNAYCSPFTSYQHRLNIQRQLKDRVASEPLARGLNIEADLEHIFEYERHCASRFNKDKRKNGSMMWYYLRFWQQQISQQPHKKANIVPEKPQSGPK